jgi:hypothetical protein
MCCAMIHSHNTRAFGIGLERIAMALFRIPVSGVCVRAHISSHVDTGHSIVLEQRREILTPVHLTPHSGQ